MLAELDQFKAQQLSMLGLLAALIALLAVTASIATRVQADQAIRNYSAGLTSAAGQPTKMQNGCPAGSA